jgi:hypothetical protein
MRRDRQPQRVRFCALAYNITEPGGAVVMGVSEPDRDAGLPQGSCGHVRRHMAGAASILC